ncbi:MAG: response regulator [Lachnospiraceae bacterium]|nr:response regulator [Candidatus Merdinaster equi]
MFSAYLVDDEELILDEFIRTIPWMDNGFEVVGSNVNPEVACSEIKSLKPDVVFCDLKMIGMSGNDLIKTLKESGVDCEFVMISAYDNFDNVRTFFQQSGFDYILKPVQLDDIQMVLERLVLRLKEIKPEKNQDKEGSKNACFDELINYIDDNFSSRITLDLLSKKFGFSKNYICNLFSKYYNTSLTCYLTEKRMIHAKELLADKNKLLKDIAIECGYREYVQFYKVFKEFYKSSPKEMIERQ